MGLLSNLAASIPTYRSIGSYSGYSSDMSDVMGFAIIGTVLTFYALFFVAWYVLESIFMMKLFKKANVAAWKAWVPIVNIWTFLQLGGQKGLWTMGVIGCLAAMCVTGLLTLLMTTFGANGVVSVLFGITLVILWIIMIAGPILTAVFMCISAYNIGKKLKMDSAMVVLYIFLGIVWLGIAGMGKAKFDDKQGKPNLAPTIK